MVIGRVGHRADRHDAAAQVRPHNHEAEKMPNGTGEVRTDINRQQHSLATFARNNENETSGRPLGLRTAAVR